MPNPKWAHLMNWQETSKWQGFEKNPQNRNTKWRPKKWISAINEELVTQWYAPATKADIEETYLSMFQLEEKILKNMLSDVTKPMIARIIAKALLSWKGFEVLEKMLDRWVGKPTQINDNKNNNSWEIIFKIKS